MPYVQDKAKKAKKLKIESKALLLSCVIYTNVGAHETTSQTSKTEIAAKTDNGV